MRWRHGLLWLALAGCGGPAGSAAPDAGPVARAAPAIEEGPDGPEPGPVPLPLAAGQEIAVPAGVVRAGSRPGTRGRDPRREADLVAVQIPAFSIDRLPYPNDPTRPPLVDRTRAEASALCAREGKRLCTELEWERACKGDTTREHPGGGPFDLEACGLDPLSCASPLDVLSMGVTHFEWTLSDVSRGLGSDRWSAVVRGGRADDPPAAHRCGARHALAPDDAGGSVTFRCCRGEVPELAYPQEPRRRLFREEEVPEARLREILATMPELAPYAGDFRLSTAEQIDRVLGGGGRTRETVPWNFPEQVLVWSPVAGEELWLVAGSGGGSSLIAAFHPLPDGTFVHGASFVLRDEPVPVALAWDQGTRDQVHWSACWGCAAEGGGVLLREDLGVVVVQR